MTAKKKPVRVSRKAEPVRRRPAPFAPAPTDRMWARGMVKACWYDGTTCGQCGGPVATDGQTTWCAGTCDPWTEDS